MKGQDNAQLREILDQAAQLPPDQRDAFLQSACGDDVALHAEIESLLESLDKAGGFLGEPTFGPDALSSRLAQTGGPHAGRPGEMIGRYKLLQLIGEGGFGSVFMAEQQTPVVRKVALKIIKPGMDSAAIIARFEAERQALAMMDHPNIARVLDAGTTEAGRPYFVMELVQGIPINKYCDRKRLKPRQRIELFVPVCRAVQHAHQKGIIHRDLKPSNILVMTFDGQPVPKVIDFGVAKALNQRLTEKTLFTQFGHAIGTPEYMSPEQAEMDVIGADTRSDIYSLGALLYELLTGVTPLDRVKLHEAGYAQMLRIIREEEPVKPSTRLTQSGDTLANISADRGTDARELTRLTSGDLDWIVMKCLEKDRARRYETADGLARDLERYLHDEPVEATPPALSYKVRKLIQKHKGEAAAILAVVAALMLGMIGTSIGLVRARHHLATTRAAESLARQNALEMERQRNIAAANEIAALEAAHREASQRKQAQAVAGILEAMFQHLDPHGARRGDLELRSQLVAELEKIAATPDPDGSGDPLVRARLRDSLGWTLLQLGETDKALPLLHSAAKDRKSAASPEDAASCRILYHLGVALFNAQYFADALKFLEEAQTWQIRNLGANDPQTLKTSLELGGVYCQVDRYSEGIALVTHVHDEQAASLGPDDPDTLKTLLDLAKLYGNVGRFNDSIRLAKEVYERQVKTLSADHPDALITQQWLAVMYGNAGRYEEALSLFTKVLDEQSKTLGPEHRDTLVTKRLLAESYALTGRYGDAIKIMEDLEEIDARRFGLDDPEIEAITASLANDYDGLGRFSDAIGLLEKLVDQRVRLLGENNRATIGLQSLLAYQYARAGRYDQAIRLAEAARDKRLAALGPNDPAGLNGIVLNLSEIYTEAGRRDDAIRLLESFVKKTEQLWGPDGFISLNLNYRLARVYALERRYEDAIGLLKRTMDFAAHNGNFGYWGLAEQELLEVYRNAGRDGDAIHLAEQARQMQFAAPLIASDMRPIVLAMRLSSLYLSNGRIADAIKLQEEIRQNASQQFGPDAGLTVLNTDRLILLYNKAGRIADAKKLLRETLPSILRALQDPRTIRQARDLATFYRKIGPADEALDFLKQVRQASIRAFGPDSDLSRDATDDLLVLYNQLDQKPEANKLIDASIAHLSEQLGHAGGVGREQLLQKRATLFARADKFKEAAADYREAAQLVPDDQINWHDGFVPLLFQVGDVEGYRRARSEELRKFATVSDQMVAHRVAKDAFLAPIDGEDLKIANELTDRALSRDLTDWPYGYQTRGMSEYRMGHYPQAIVFLIMARESEENHGWRAEDDLFMALAWQKMGNHARALAALDLATREWNSTSSSILRKPPMDYILYRSMSREAFASIDPTRSAAVPIPSTIDDSWAFTRDRLKSELEALPRELPGGAPLDASFALTLRGYQYARIGQFEQACADLARAIDRDPDNQANWHGYLPLLLQTGKTDAYRQWRTKELRKFGGITDFKYADRVAKDCLMLPAEGEELTKAVALADRASESVYDSWNIQLKALTAYRLGHYDQAVSWGLKMEQAVDFRAPGMNAVLAAMTKPLLAMAYHKLGQEQLAKRALADAEELVDKLPRPATGDLTAGNFMDWILAQCLFREAEELIRGNSFVQSASTQPSRN